MNYKERFDELMKVELPQSSKVETLLPVWCNGKFSILKKVDGTFSIKIEATHKEYGHFLTQKEAEDFIKEDTTTE